MTATAASPRPLKQQGPRQRHRGRGPDGGVAVLLERLGQVPDGGRAVEHRLGAAELQQHPGTTLQWRRFGQGAHQIAGRARRQSGSSCFARCLLENVTDPLVAARRRQRQVERDRTRAAAALVEEPCCALVRERAFVRRNVFIDRRADQRMHERGVRVAAEDLGGQQGGRRHRRVVGPQPGRLGKERQIAGTHDRSSARKPQRVITEAPETHQDGARDRPRSEVGHRGDLIRARRDALHLQGADQLPEQQRIAAGGRMARRRERLVGMLAQPLAHKVGRRRVAERSGPYQYRQRVADDLGHKRGPRASGAGPHRADDGHPDPVEPADEVVEEAEGGLVAPVKVVDGDRQRRVRRQRDGEPVERMQHRERGILGTAAAACGAGRGAEHLARSGDRAGKRLDVIRFEVALEQLPHHPECEIDLELAAPGSEHPDAGVARTARPLGEEPRLCQGRREFPRCDDGNSPSCGRPVRAGRSDAMASRWRRMR